MAPRSLLTSSRCSNVAARRHRRDAQSTRPQARNSIEQAGSELRYLPPYSTDLNPNEMAFAIKAILKKAAARTVEELWQTVTDAVHRRRMPQPFADAGYDAV